MLSGVTWKKGQSGNPGGRLKGVERQFREEFRALTARVATSLDDPNALGAEVDGLTAMIRRLWTIAMTAQPKDAVPAMKLALGYALGMPKQVVSIDDAPDNEPEEDLSDLSLAELRALAKVKATPDGVH